MRKFLVAVVSLVVVFAVIGCSSAPMEEKYGDGREKQKAKADKMIEGESGTE